MSKFLQTMRPIGVICASVAILLVAGGVQAQSGLQNPLNASFSDIPKFIAGVLRLLVVIALPVIVLFFVISGFMFVMARGNESKLTKAKENFVYVTIGALLILGAWAIAELINATVQQLV